MRIASSQVNMTSSRFYSQMGIKSNNNKLGNESFMKTMSKAYGNVNSNASVNAIGDSSNMPIDSSSFSQDVLGSMLKRLSSAGAFGGGYTGQLVTYQESETTSFSASGVAVTEDGREIGFGINVSMSRQFMQYMNVSYPSMQNALTDPLVVNIGTDSAKVSGQKFKFDIDMDGILDNISMPTKGSAFIAFDKNEDGIINDGSELFGTKSGDGFKDLSEYDSDGNGWIDENDEVFDKLKVWYKDENGKDVLMSLKDADIGAIFLGEQESEFSLNNPLGNTSAVIRSSGIFLRESGGVGTVQHVDIAKMTDSELAAEEAREELNNVGAMTVNLDSGNNRRSKSSARKANDKAIRDRQQARKKIIDEQIEKRRMEREKLEELYEKNLEYHKEFMKAIGF